MPTPNLRMPSFRKLFVPDEGYALIEIDLKGADARVVAWEANDGDLKQAFRDGLDIHTFNMLTIWPTAPESQHKVLRQKAKTAVHATNYGCKARTLADHLNISVREAEAFITKWFRLHPRIAEWHRRVERQLHSTRAISNRWGYRRAYFDRVDSLLPEALAWIGQSTTAIAVNKLIVALCAAIPAIEPLLQVHDSFLFQIPLAAFDPQRLTTLSSVVVPYDDPLVMPCEISISTTSWGDMQPLGAEHGTSPIELAIVV